MLLLEEILSANPFNLNAQEQSSFKKIAKDFGIDLADPFAEPLLSDFKESVSSDLKGLLQSQLKKLIAEIYNAFANIDQYIGRGFAKVPTMRLEPDSSRQVLEATISFCSTVRHSVIEILKNQGINISLQFYSLYDYIDKIFFVFAIFNGLSITMCKDPIVTSKLSFKM